MYELLKGLRVVEASSFVAAPSCGLYLLQMGAEVIRIDPLGGGPDYHRWPRAPGGASLYWEGLNKGKKSVALDLSRPEGRELAIALATAPGPDAGLVVTNYPLTSFMAHERLAARRGDLISVRVMGWSDGTNAVDYTVNAAVGLPHMTGPPELDDPVNHVLPAWDLLTGSQAAFALLAAERQRRSTGRGQEVRLSLGDVAMTTLGNLGQIAEVELTGTDRPRIGNHVYGTFGRDFTTLDGQRVMVVAITAKQWSSLVASLDLGGSVANLESEFRVSFRDEGARYLHRDRIASLIAAKTSQLALQDLVAVFDRSGVCWGQYRTLSEALTQDRRFSTQNAVLGEVRHPSGATYRTPGSAAIMIGETRRGPPSAPRLGEHTQEVLSAILGVSDLEIRQLEKRGIV